MADSVASEPPLKAFMYFRLPGVTVAHALDEIQGDVRNAVERRRESHLLHLFSHGLEKARMAVPQRGYEDAADRIEIPFAFGVPVIQPFRSLDNQRVEDEFRHGVKVDESALEQCLLTGSDFHKHTSMCLKCRWATPPHA